MSVLIAVGALLVIWVAIRAMWIIAQALLGVAIGVCIPIALVVAFLMMIR